MSVHGIGTDVVDVRRVARLWERYGRSFAERWFTAAEISDCESRTCPERHLAARLAAKEAVWKALDIPWDGGVPWRSIVVTTAVPQRDKVHLGGEVARRAEARGCGSVLVATSHTPRRAVAFAVVLSGAVADG